MYKMNNAEILAHVDHTVLKATTSREDIKKICDEAMKYKTASVCIPPSYVSFVKENYKDINICTVIGFALGYSTTETKVFETKNAIENGADEIDFVINIGQVKNGNYDYILNEIKEIKKTAGNRIVKVIVETCYLTEEEKIKLCQLVTEGGADFIKTSTGFGTAGAVYEDIFLFKKHIGENVKIKASGGIRTKEDFVKYLEAGCERIGASSAIEALA